MPDHLTATPPSRPAFPPDAPVEVRVAASKEYLHAGRERLRLQHKSSASGLAVVRGLAGLIDGLLIALTDAAVASWAAIPGHPSAPLALVALGGYGRGELSPLSDVDVMFLLPSKTRADHAKPMLEHFTREIFYVLWDCDLKVGHSTRTVDEVFTEARKDIQTFTSLLEARFIAGSATLYESFAQAYRSFYTTEDPKGYIAARLDDQRARRAKFGDTPFLQEPDVKNGVGGLRDYQNTLWMARVKLGITSLDELVAQRYLAAAELLEFRRSYDYLLRVRNELHFMSRHATDVLSLDVQARLAHHLGYTEKNELQRIEQFMHDYYTAAQAIFRLSKLVEDRLALSIGRGETAKLSFKDVLLAGKLQRAKHIDGFAVRGRLLVAERPEVFAEDPVRLLRVFRHCQQLDCKPDFHLAALIRASLNLITPAIVESKDANITFRAILAEAGGVFPVLQLMHEVGVLGRFIPEFDALTCLVQHEYYHRYTADVHTLETIRQLDLIFSEAEPITLKYRSALHGTAEPTLLYLTLLLHDIGKARGIRGHAESGVIIAGPLLDRMGVSPEGRALVEFTIKNHLVMARFWQKRDVDDPQTPADFAAIVGDAERLRHLYVHTFCDARGTAASLWNGYKDTLHTALYLGTLEHLKLGPAIKAGRQEKIAMIQQELILKKVPGISAEEITAHFGLLPERYFIQTDADEIALHLTMVNRLLRSISAADSIGALRPVIEWRNDLNRSLTVVNIVTWDRAGLFYKLAGALSVAGLSILGAKVISRRDHIAIDTFYVVEPGRGVVQDAAAQATFARTVEAALVENKDLYPEILAQAKKIYSPRPAAGPQLTFPPSVEVYHEAATQRTIVEVQARDQIGLLYRLAKTISDQGFDITFSRVGTERGVAIDTFYIKCSTTAQDIDRPRLDQLRETLAGLIAPVPPPAAAP